MLIFLVFLHWYETEKIKEIALNATRQHCQAMQVLMLDDYIAFKSLGFSRSKGGKIQIIRAYGFEFTSTGDERYNGRIKMSGNRVESIYMEPYRINTD
jgi:hypothetical protein